jgi:hypothetical protein
MEPVPPPPKKFISEEHGYAYELVNGIVYPPFMRAECVAQAQAEFQLRDSDIVVATYPKCGTTWLQQILLLLAADGDVKRIGDPMVTSPWIEAEACRAGLAALEAYADPRVLKTHAPAHMVPWKGGLEGANHKTKIVVVCRNMFDAAVSMFHHSRDVPVFEYTGDWNHFFGLFLAGQVEHGSFWDWQDGWWKAHLEHPAQIMWITYEDLSKNLEHGIRRIADFVGLPASDDLVKSVAQASCFQASSWHTPTTTPHHTHTHTHTHLLLSHPRA